MGEIAEQMLNGEICEVCGEFIDDPQGFPTTCAGCSGVAVDAAEYEKEPDR